MIYVKKLIIENFQSHKYSEIELDPGLNVIVGPSDQGKSAIIRALKWVFFNEPRGFEFLRHGETATKVTVHMSNGNIITRERSSSKNRYTVVNENQETQVYEGFGNDIPQEVISAHRVEKAVIDTGSDIGLNLADQLEAPFLLSENGGVKAKAIGRLTGVHIIDKAVAMTLADIKRENLNKGKIDDEFEKVAEDLKAFEGLEEKIENIKNCESILELIQQKAKNLEDLSSLNEKLIHNSKETVEQNKILDTFKDIDRISLEIASLDNKYSLYYRLKDLKNRYELINKLTSEQENVINKTKDIDTISEVLNSIIDGTKKLQTQKEHNKKLQAVNREIEVENKILEKLKNINDAENSLSSSLDNITKLNKLIMLKKQHEENMFLIEKGKNYLNDRDIEIENLVEQYSKVLKDIGKCPVCFSDIDNNTICHIVSSMKGE